MKRFKNRIIQILVLQLLLMGTLVSRAWGYYDPELAQAFASFIETMAGSVQTVNRGATICLYGNDDVTLRIQSRGKSVIFLDADIASKKNRYSECRIIYVAKDNEKFVKSFIGVFNKSGALTVAAFDSFVNDGGMVFVDLGRRDFELTVNAKVFRASGVKLDSSVTGLIINNR